MEKLLEKKKTAFILAIIFSVIAIASIVVIVVSTVNFLYVPLIIATIIFVGSDYAFPLFWISFWDYSRMIKIVCIMQDDAEIGNEKIRELMGLKSRKYVDRLICKIQNGAYLE